MNVFTYGTLMFPQVWQRLIGSQYHSVTATLSGYRRFSLNQRPYPGVVITKSEDKVQGLLYLAVSETDQKRLDQFEGDEYRQEQVEVFTDNGERLNAVVYAIKPGHYSLISNQAWNAQAFIEKELTQFLNEI